MKALPSSWTMDRLKDISAINSSSLSSNTDPAYEFDYLEISNVNYFGIIDPEAIERIQYENAPSRARRRVGKRNTIISSVRPNLQAVAYLPEVGDNFVCSTGFNVVDPNENSLNSQFAYFALISEEARQYFEATAKGVGYPAVDDKDFNTFNLPLPPLPEQERIAAFLDASCAAIDAAVAAKRRQIETLEKFWRSTLDSIFTKTYYLSERIKDITIKISSGITPDGGASTYLDAGIPFLRSQNVHFDGLHLDDVAYISKDTHDTMANSQLSPGDVLINITGASIGRCTFVPENFGEGNVNQHVCIIRPGGNLNYRFLAAFLASPVAQDQILSTFTGASRQGLSHKDLSLIKIPYPDLQEQQEIVTIIEEHKKKNYLILSSIDSQISTLLSYRKSLIHECMTGQRRIKEADVIRGQRMEVR